MSKAPRRRSHLIKYQTQLGMTRIRRDIAIRNSLVARGEIEDIKSSTTVICGCGCPGCVFVVRLPPR